MNESNPTNNDQLNTALAVPVETLSPAAKRKKSTLRIILAILAFFALAALILVLIKTISPS